MTTTLNIARAINDQRIADERRALDMTFQDMERLAERLGVTVRELILDVQSGDLGRVLPHLNALAGKPQPRKRPALMAWFNAA